METPSAHCTVSCSISVCEGQSKAVMAPACYRASVCNTAPSSGLVDALCDEVGGKSVLKLAPVLKRVVHLGIGHAAAFKPAVEDLGDPLQLAFPTAGRDS